MPGEVRDRSPGNMVVRLSSSRAASILEGPDDWQAARPCRPRPRALVRAHRTGPMFDALKRVIETGRVRNPADRLEQLIQSAREERAALTDVLTVIASRAAE